jgi:uncharacterized protein HemX
MQAVQKLAETASSVETLTWLTSGAAIVAITVGKVLWHFWQKKKKEPKNDTQAFLTTIGAMAREFEELRNEVVALAQLKEDNEQLKKKVAELEAENAKQEIQLRRLSTQVRNLKTRLKKTK